MSADVGFERLLADVLADAAPMSVPDRLVPDIRAAAIHARRRPRWLALAMERPMHLRAEVVVGSPGVRVAFILALTLLLTTLLLGAAVVGVSLLTGPTKVLPPERGEFSRPGALLRARSAHSATLLADGRVLVIGGWGGDTPLASTELWDPATGLFTSTGSLAGGRGGHTGTLLPDGRVLVVGGGVMPAEIWDPSTGRFIVGWVTRRGPQRQHRHGTA